MHKCYILDTNILLLDPNSPQQFEDNHVVIPLGVIRELDKFKKEMNSELGRNARVAVRELDALRKNGNLGEGIKTDRDGLIQVVPSIDRNQHVDYDILDLAKKLNSADVPCIVVTKDINLRIQCDVMGILVEDYETGQVDISNEIYTGHVELSLPRESLEEFRHAHKLALPPGEFSPNQYVHMTADDGQGNNKAMGRVNSNCDAIIPLIRAPRELGAIQPKNMEQNFLMDALLDDNISLVTVAGRAGSGKTLLSVAVGFYLTVECRKYMRMLVARPIFPMGNDLGYLPGTVEEKLLQWTIPIYDAFDFIADHQSEKKGGKGKDKNFKDKNSKAEDTHKTNGRKLMEASGKVEVEPLTYIRGRSLHRQFVLIDESQNLNPLEIKTIITRAGPGTKIIITGDVGQIDNDHLDSMSNGLSYVIGRFRGQSIYAHVTLEKGERSKLSDLASKLL